MTKEKKEISLEKRLVNFEEKKAKLLEKYSMSEEKKSQLQKLLNSKPRLCS